MASPWKGTVWEGRGPGVLGGVGRRSICHLVLDTERKSFRAPVPEEEPEQEADRRSVQGDRGREGDLAFEPLQPVGNLPRDDPILQEAPDKTHGRAQEQVLRTGDGLEEIPSRSRDSSSGNQAPMAKPG